MDNSYILRGMVLQKSEEFVNGKKVRRGERRGEERRGEEKRREE